MDREKTMRPKPYTENYRQPSETGINNNQRKKRPGIDGQWEGVYGRVWIEEQKRKLVIKLQYQK